MFRTDVTGPKSAKTAIVFIYDVFGYTPQTIQGAVRSLVAWEPKDEPC